MSILCMLQKCITQYGSTLCIGIEEVLAHYACTFENSNLHFYNVRYLEAPLQYKKMLLFSSFHQLPTSTPKKNWKANNSVAHHQPWCPLQLHSASFC